MSDTSDRNPDLTGKMSTILPRSKALQSSYRTQIKTMRMILSSLMLISISSVRNQICLLLNKALMNQFLTCHQKKQNTKISLMIQACSQTQTRYLVTITNHLNQNYCLLLKTQIRVLTLCYQWVNHLILSTLRLSIQCKLCSIHTRNLTSNISLRISK